MRCEHGRPATSWGNRHVRPLQGAEYGYVRGAGYGCGPGVDGHAHVREAEYGYVRGAEYAYVRGAGGHAYVRKGEQVPTVSRFLPGLEAGLPTVVTR